MYGADGRRIGWPVSLFSTVPGALKFLLPLAAGGALAGAIALGAGSGGGGHIPTPLSSSGQQTATPILEDQVTSTPSPTVSLGTQVQRPVDPISAAQIGRADCPLDWLAWKEAPKGRFSICYPQTLNDGIEATSYNSGTHPPDEVLWLHTPNSTNRDTASVVFSLTISLSSRSMLRPQGQSCPGLVPAQQGSGVEGTITISGHLARTCQASGQDFIQGKAREITELLVELPVKVGADELFLKVVLDYQGGLAKTASEAMALRVIQTVLVY